LIPLLYLKGVSTGQMQEALGALVGVDARGFSSALVSRLKAKWTKEYEEFRKRPIEGEWLYLWVDGIYSKMRKESDKLCLLVVMGVNSRGEKKILAIEDGFRESAESWKEVPRDLKERGLKDPLLAIGDGALGFWAAVREIFPTIQEQRCWVHKTLNNLNFLPKSLQARAKAQIREIWNAENRKEVKKALQRFVKAYEDKYPKAGECLKKDKEVLLAF
jgi:transposase-like protein